MTTRLLVALHPGFTHTPAIERARAIAGQTDTDVLIYSAVHDPYSAGTGFGDDTVMREVRNSMLAGERNTLEAAKAEIVGVAKNVEIQAEWAAPAAAAVAVAATRFGADLIVASSTQHNPVARWI